MSEKQDSPADTRVSEEGGEGAPGVRADIAMKIMVRQLFPSSPGASTVEQRFPCSL